MVWRPFLAALLVSAGLAGCIADDERPRGTGDPPPTAAPEGPAAAPPAPEDQPPFPRVFDPHVVEDGPLRMEVRSARTGPDTWLWTVTVEDARATADHDLYGIGVCGTPVRAEIRLADEGRVQPQQATCPQTPPLTRWTPVHGAAWQVSYVWNGTTPSTPADPRVEAGDHRLDVGALVLAAPAGTPFDDLRGDGVHSVGADLPASTDTDVGEPDMALAFEADPREGLIVNGTLIATNQGTGWAYASTPGSCDHPIHVQVLDPQGQPVETRAPPMCLALGQIYRAGAGIRWELPFSWNGTRWANDFPATSEPVPPGTYTIEATVTGHTNWPSIDGEAVFSVLAWTVTVG